MGTRYCSLGGKRLQSGGRDRFENQSVGGKRLHRGGKDTWEDNSVGWKRLQKDERIGGKTKV